MSEYNYRHFPLDLDAATFAAFPDGLLREVAGERAVQELQAAMAHVGGANQETKP